MLRFILTYSILIFLASCTCGPTGEGDMNVIFIQNNTQVEDLVFDEVYGVGGNGPIVRFGSIEQLPLSVRSNIVSYIFRRGSKLDTLTFSYSKTTSFQSEECGFIVKYSSPFLINTTFPRVELHFVNDIIKGSIYEATIYL